MADFRVLGPIEVVVDGGCAVMRPRERALLAALILADGRVVSSDRLIEALWPDRGASGTMALRTQVARLRRALGPAADAVQTEPAGYACTSSRAHWTPPGSPR